MERLVAWIADEHDARDSILGIPCELAHRPKPDDGLGLRWRGHRLDTPFGVAAGPHSQLAGNIVAAFLCGARMIELKTVQTLEQVTVSKPCIDMQDVGYNIEWSQELTLEESFDQYLEAWVLVHVLHHRLGLAGGGPGVVFDVSVGYDLQGVRQPNMQRFLDRCLDAGDDLDRTISRVAARIPEAASVEVPSRLAGGLTLSTMHGCRPDEIGLIAEHLMERCRLPTTVKLNPTVLGADEVRAILHDNLGFDDVALSMDAFDGDPSFDEVVRLVRRLSAEAQRRGVDFGVKLANTLPVINHRDVFPLDESRMYLSGRPLHAIAVRAAARLQEELEGRLAVSFAGGADAFSTPALLAAGLRPVTVCSDLLRPGGYLRLRQYVEHITTAMRVVGARTLDELVLRTAGDWQPDDDRRASRLAEAALQNLTSYADSVLQDPSLRDGAVDRSTTKSDRPLEAFDCIAAPCTEACAVGQRVPEYLRRLRVGDVAGAASVIRDDNPLPGILGRACHHPCELPCLRTHLDQPVAVRDLKRSIIDRADPPARARLESTGDVKVAVIGAGPCGLAAAEFLARHRFEVTVFESRSASGGMVSGTIPGFRASPQVVEKDLTWLAAAGVQIHHGRRVGTDITIEGLRAQGFRYIVAAAGAQKGAKLKIPGEDTSGVWDGLVFLRAARSGQLTELAGRIGVVGGGDVAIDCARTARRLGAADVTVIYRRSRRQMPAQREEIESLEAEGATILEQMLPLAVLAERGRLVALRCATTMLGEPDASGRQRPIRLWGSDRELPLDVLVVAVGQRPDLGLFRGCEPRLDERGYPVVDASSLETSIPDVFAGGDLIGGGRASIVAACGDGRRIANAIAAREGRRVIERGTQRRVVDRTELLRRRAYRQPRQPVRQRPASDRSGFDEVILGYGPEAAAVEASRCLDCDLICSTCESVCPNRAIFTYETDGRNLEVPVVAWRSGELVEVRRERVVLRQPYQVAVLADLCNDCGNCATFCPAAGRPFADKPRLFLDAAAFRREGDNTFRLVARTTGWSVQAMLQGTLHELLIGDALTYRASGVELRLEPETLSVLDARLDGDPPADEISLRPVFTMHGLYLGLRRSVPWIPLGATETGR